MKVFIIVLLSPSEMSEVPFPRNYNLITEIEPALELR